LWAGALSRSDRQEPRGSQAAGVGPLLGGGAVVGIPGGPLGGLSPGGPAVRTPGPVLRALAVSEQDRVGRTLAALLALAHLPTDCGRGQSLRQGATGAGRGQPPPLCLAQPA